MLEAIIPGVFIDGKAVPLPPPEATHLVLYVHLPQDFRKFFLGTVLRKNNWKKFGEGLEGGIKKLRRCLQKGNATIHYIGEEDDFYTFRLKGPLVGWGLEETVKEFGHFIRVVRRKSSTFARYLRKEDIIWKAFWCNKNDEVLVPLTKEEAAEREAQDSNALADKPIRIHLPQGVRKNAVKILNQLGGAMEILSYLNKRFFPFSFSLKASPGTLYVSSCPANEWDGSEAKREVKELFSEMMKLEAENERRSAILKANATKTLIQKAKAKETLPAAEVAETHALKVPRNKQPWPKPQHLQRPEEKSAETAVLKAKAKETLPAAEVAETHALKVPRNKQPWPKPQELQRPEEKSGETAVLKAKAEEALPTAEVAETHALKADPCEDAGHRGKDIKAKKEKKEEHSRAKVERKPVILKAAQARAQEETGDEAQPGTKKKVILKAAPGSAEQASHVEETNYNEVALRARQQEVVKKVLAKENLQNREDTRTTDDVKTAIKEKEVAEVDYRYFCRGVADVKDQEDDIDEAGDTEVEDADDEEEQDQEDDIDEAGDTEVEDADDEEEQEEETADVTEAGDTEVEDASDEEDNAKVSADVTEEAAESEDGQDGREETHRRQHHRHESNALRDSKARKSPRRARQERGRRRRSRRQESRSRRRERSRKDKDEERRRQLEAEETRRKKEEEEELRKLKEEARRKKDEDQRLRQRAEEEELRKLKEEARSKQEEDQRQRAKEEELRKLKEEARSKQEEDQRQRAEEEEFRKLKEEVTKKKEKEKELASLGLEEAEEEGSWSPQDGQDQDEDKEENQVSKRRRTKQARRLTQARERRIMQGWTWRNQSQDVNVEAKQKPQEAEEAEENEEVLRQKADEAERKRQQMMEEARQREKAQAEEKRRIQEEASQGEKVEAEEKRKRQLEEVRRIQEAAQTSQPLQVPMQTRPPTARPKMPYPSGIRLRVFAKAGACELPERRIVKQALTFGTASHCDVVLPPGPGVQGEHLKLGYHELKGWSLQPISGQSVQSAVACYPALLEKLRLECQRLPQGQKKDEVIDLLARLRKDEQTSRLTQGGEGRLKLSENLCVFTLGTAKTPERLFFLDLIFGEWLKEDPQMDLAEVAQVPAVPKEVPQLGEEIQVQGAQGSQPMEAEEAPGVSDPAEMQVSAQTMEQSQGAPIVTVQADVPSEPDTVRHAEHAEHAEHAVADTVDAMQSMAAPVDEPPSNATDGELLCEVPEEVEDAQSDHLDDRSHNRQEDSEQVEAKMGEEQPEDTTIEIQQDAEMPALSKEVLGGEDPLAEDASGSEQSEHVSEVTQVTQEDSPKDADVKDFKDMPEDATEDVKELTEPTPSGQDDQIGEHAAEVATSAAKTEAAEVPIYLTPEAAATAATSKAPGPQLVRPAAKPKAIPSRVLEVKHHYDGEVLDYVQKAENLALKKYAKMPPMGHRPRSETWRWRARRASVAEDGTFLPKEPEASPIDGFPDSGESWKDIAKARATRIILKRVREEADQTRNAWEKQREKKRRTPTPLPTKVPVKIYNLLRNAYQAYKLFSPWLSPVMRMQLTQEIWYTVRYVEDQFADELFWRKAAGETMDVPIPVHQVKLRVVPAVPKKPPMEPPPRKRSRSPRRAGKFQTLKVPVDEVEFSQDSIAQRFTCGRHLQSTVADLRSGEVDPLDVKQYPFMRLLALRIDDRIISRCNRRLWCLREVQRLKRTKRPDHIEHVWVKVQEPSEVMKDMIRQILPPKPLLDARLTDKTVQDDQLGALMADEAER